jgi:hypothetical protein
VATFSFDFIIFFAFVPCCAIGKLERFGSKLGSNYGAQGYRLEFCRISISFLADAIFFFFQSLNQSEVSTTTYMSGVRIHMLTRG